MGCLRSLPALTAALLCTACAGAGAGPQLCTEMGAPDGISIVVSEGMADGIGEDAQIEVCADGCRIYELDLRPGNEAVDEGCDSTEPDGSCSASMRPDGTLVGFVHEEQLTAEEVTVTLLTGGERYSTTGTPQLVYPNGPDCPGEALQLSLTLENGALSP